MNKPVLLMDVDGVINCFGNLGLSLISYEAEFKVDVHVRDMPVEDGGTVPVIRTFTIRVPEGTRDRVAELEQHFDCHWATTWEKHAPELLSPRIGFGADWPVMQMIQLRLSDTTEKLGAVQHHLKTHAAGRPAAWVDDLLFDDARWSFELRSEKEAPSLLVRTEANCGLTDTHVRALIDFAAACRD